MGGIVEGDGGIDGAVAGAPVVDVESDVVVDVVEDEEPHPLSAITTTVTAIAKKTRSPLPVERIRIT